MSEKPLESDVIAEDERTLRSLGYQQELARKMGGFSNYAISLSIICILAGGVTSFHQGLSSVGGAAFGLGWPLVCLFSLAVAATMGQVASSFPTAGGLYHWASILGGKGWGWTTAWLNHTVTLPVSPGNYRILSHTGETISLKRATLSGLVLTLTNTPQYIVLEKP